MKTGKRTGLSILFAAALLATAVIVPSMGVSPDVSITKSEKALEYISQKHGMTKEQLMITNEKEANFPLSNQKIWSVKILDTKSKEAYGVDLDEAGNIADIKAAKALEDTKYKKKYGKKEIALQDKLEKMKPDDTVEVGIWLSQIAEKPKTEQEISEEDYKEIMDAKKKTYSLKQKPVLDILKAKKIKIKYVSQYAPLIYAEVPAKLMDEVENIPDVDGIYVEREFKPLLNKADLTYKVKPVWDAGVTGSGIKVAVVEAGGIDFSNTNLKPGSYFNPKGSPYYFISMHTTEVAGIIGSQHVTYKGVSYGAPRLLSANAGNFKESSLINASEWAMINGATILSNSWGDDTGLIMGGMDKYLDHIVWYHYKTVTAAAGNNYTGTGNIDSPGLAYNVITVGGFQDNNNGYWPDDIMWGKGNSPGSAWRDPYWTDREKPEVVAIATHGSENIMTTKAGGTLMGRTDFAGTSYAAPAVAGEAALLMQKYNNFKYWPEVIKAIIMASADHNIEGESRLSDYDGAGGIDILKAYETGAKASGWTASASDFPKDFPFFATQGQKVRVVITWDSHPDHNRPTTRDDLQTDLDLNILDPSGRIMSPRSNSWDNNYEIIEFTAPTTGAYNARVLKFRFDGTTEYVGFAYAYV